MALRLVAGLGNPGSQYRGSYHNLGYRAVDVLAARYETRRTDHRPARLMAVRDGPVAYLGKPDCFVNRSGSVLSAWSRSLGVPPEDCLIVYDDFSLDAGVVRLRPSGGPGGHRGMKDVIESMGTSDVPRLRIGIGPLPGGVNPEDYVLGRIHSEHEAILEAVLEAVPEMVESIREQEFEAAMSRWNGHRFGSSE